MKILNQVAMATIACLLLTTLVVSCLKTSNKDNQFAIVQNNNTGYVAMFGFNQYNYQYDSRIENGKTLSKLKISGKNMNIQLEYVLDTSVADYRLLQHTKVQAMVNELPQTIHVEAWRSIADGLFKMIEYIFNDPGITKRNGESVFFYQAALRTKLRSLEQRDPNYTCVPYPAYLLGRSFFFCQEDVLVKRELVLSIFNDHPDLLQVERNRQIHAMVKNATSDIIPFDQIYAFSMSKEQLLLTIARLLNKNGIERTVDGGKTAVVGDCGWWCLLGCGTDGGCCGNYSGCCLYASLECYIHDRICSNCEPRWFCFKGCVPDKK